MKRILILVAVLVGVALLTVGCNNSYEEEPQEGVESTNFRYGIVYSSMSSDSKIVLIDDLGQEVNQVKTDILGISLAGFMKYPI